MPKIALELSAYVSQGAPAEPPNSDDELLVVGPASHDPGSRGPVWPGHKMLVGDLGLPEPDGLARSRLELGRQRRVSGPNAIAETDDLASAGLAA